MNDSLCEIRRSKSSDEIKNSKIHPNPFQNEKRFHFSTAFRKKHAIENTRTIFTSTDSTNDHCLNSKSDLHSEYFNFYTKIPTPKYKWSKEDEFFKPVDFDFMTSTEKKSFHYDLKIFGKKKEDSLIGSDIKDFAKESKSFSYSRFRRKDSLSDNKQLNLGVDPFSTSLKAFNPEASYENSFLQNENVGEINVPIKKSFHFINKFSQREKSDPSRNYAKNINSNCNNEMYSNDFLNIQKIELGTSITEFGENDLCYKKSPKSFYDSINFDIPEENTKRLIINKMNFISNVQQHLTNFPLKCSSPKNPSCLYNINQKIETLMSFNEESSKESRIAAKKFENLSKIPDIECQKKPLQLKESGESRQSFSNFLHDVRESLEKNSRSFFYRNKTPEFAKFFQKNMLKEPNFFKIEKPKEEIEQPLIFSRDTKFCDKMGMNHFSEFSEKKTEEEYDCGFKNEDDNDICQINENKFQENIGEKSSIKESKYSGKYDESDAAMKNDSNFLPNGRTNGDFENKQNIEIENIMQKNFMPLEYKNESENEQSEKENNLNLEEIEEISRNSRYKRALSLNLMKYHEMEKILHEITKQKNKLGVSLQKLVKLHKNNINIESDLLVNEKEIPKNKEKKNFRKSKGIDKILNRFLEDPKENKQEYYNKFFQKNYFFSGNAQKNDLKKPKKSNQYTINSPIISELSLNTTININNNSNTNLNNNNAYLCLNNKNQKNIKSKKNDETIYNKNETKKTFLNRTYLKKNEKSYNKENNSYSQNIPKMNKSKNF